MGGIGSRFGSSIPKQFTFVDGKPIFVYILEAYRDSKFVDHITIIVNSGWKDYAQELIMSYNLANCVSIVSGGKSRSESVKNALYSINGLASSDDLVLIHDATHPYFDKKAIRTAINKMKDYDGVTLCQHEYDTCYSISETSVISEIPKKTVVSGASPEIFRFGTLYRLFFSVSSEQLASMSSVGALVLSNNLSMGYVPTSFLNIKITYPEDMIIFKLLCSNYYFGDN